MERFPHARDGLNVIERRILELLRDEPLPFGELFARVAEAFPPARWGLGDVQVERTLAEMAPMVRRDGDSWRIEHEGHAVLAGHADRFELAPVDRWLGACHLGRGKWRFDGERIVASDR